MIKISWQTSTDRWWEPSGSVTVFTYQEANWPIYYMIDNFTAVRIWLDDELLWEWGIGFVDSFGLIKIGNRKANKTITPVKYHE